MNFELFTSPRQLAFIALRDVHKGAYADIALDRVLQKANLPVEYALYTDEGHGFARPENRLHFYAVAEEFLAKYLGGRAEPVGDIQGHSGVIK